MVAMANPKILEEYAAPVTFDEWLAMPESDIRIELLNGELVVSPMANDRHQEIQFNLVYRFGRAAETIPGVHIRAGSNVRLAADGGLIPDIVLFRGRAGGKRTEYGFDGPPDLVVEILSPSNRQYDLVGKASAYARAGVPEYWIVDPVRSLLIAGKLVDGTYQRTVYAEGTVPCDALDGAEIDLGFLKSE
jgi:Uma2 family endonuclease